jgi:hypothetical membrane protein
VSLPELDYEAFGRPDARLAGASAVVVAIGCILLATMVSPTFVWANDALSDMGVDPTTAWLFNGGLIAGMLVGLPYAWALGTEVTDRLSYLRAATFLLAIVSMGGVGLFPSNDPLHFPMAAGFYVFATLTLLVDGVARLRTRSGKLALLGGIVVPAAWPVWALWLDLGPGIAVPEFVGAVVFSLWVLTLSPERPQRTDLRPE